MTQIKSLIFLNVAIIAALGSAKTLRLNSFGQTQNFVVVPQGKVKRNIGISEINEFLDESTEIKDSDYNEGQEHGNTNIPPQIYSFHVNSDIRYRYARTRVTSRLINKNEHGSAEVVFQMVLPETAFISKFLLELNGETFEAYVKEKEEAMEVYKRAKQDGMDAGLLEVNARRANVFNVNLNLKPMTKVTFNLTYEEFLVRKLGRYEYAISIRPEQISKVKDFNININILESRPIVNLKVPKIREDVEFNHDIHSEESNTEAVISQPTVKSAVISWQATDVSRTHWDGDLGKFIVRYDIARDSDAGEILLMNGYFVHFFAPRELLPLRKHVIYVLDVSGSMSGRRLEQLKDVMSTVMDDLKPDDYFNIIKFSSNSQVILPRVLGSREKAQPVLATEPALREAHQAVSSLTAMGGTNIDSALRVALEITSRVKKIPGNEENEETLPENVESLIMFLTDGEPTVGVTKLEAIIANAKARNIARVPIYTIAFGSSADFNFLKNLALQNKGFGRKIYEGGDADIQIRGFYNEISSPLLANITFKYTSNAPMIAVKKLTRKWFPNIFNGSELAIAGYLKPISGVQNKELPGGSLRNYNYSSFLTVDIDANGRDGHVSLKGHDLSEYDFDLHPINGTNETVRDTRENEASIVENDFLERLWAYITIKQLLEIFPGHGEDDYENDYVYEDFGENSSTEHGTNDSLYPSVSLLHSSNETSKQRALRLALKYGFVTPITSLVVVKPSGTEANERRNETTEEIVNLEEAKTLNKNNKPAHRPAIPIQYKMAHSLPPPRSRTRMQKTLLMTRRITPQAMSIPFLKSHQSPKPRYTSQPYRVPRIGSSIDRTPRLTLASALARGHIFNMLGPPALQLHNSNPKTSSTLPPKAMNSGYIGTLSDMNPTLSDIKWELNKTRGNGNRFIFVNGKKYIVEPVPSTGGRKENCIGGKRGQRFHGKCVHLASCVRSEFTSDFQTYTDFYFCSISSRGWNRPAAAGACCPNN